MEKDSIIKSFQRNDSLIVSRKQFYKDVDNLYEFCKSVYSRPLFFTKNELEEMWDVHDVALDILRRIVDVRGGEDNLV